MSAVLTVGRVPKPRRTYPLARLLSLSPDPSWMVGVILMVTSALAFASAGIFTKSVSAEAWDVIFWRGMFASSFTIAFIVARRQMRREVLAMGRTGVIAAIVYAGGTAAFIPAYKLTSVANVALIYAATPPLAALLAWVWLRERPARVVAAGCVLTFAGVATIVSGSTGGMNLTGDLLALYMAASFAFLMVFYRRFPHTPAAGPAAASSLILLPIALWIADPFATPPHEIAILACFGLVFAIGSVAMVEGARRLAPSEGALLSTLESPFAPILAWLILVEVPSELTLVGGALILVGVIVSQARHRG